LRWLSLWIHHPSAECQAELRERFGDGLNGRPFDWGAPT
jgi:hypothetical protein